MNASTSILSRWEPAISLLALAVSIGALFFSYRAEQASISANMVTLSTDGQLINTSDGDRSQRDILGIIDLQNAGRANIQITSAEIEVFYRDGMQPSDVLAYITENINRIPPNSSKPAKDLVFELDEPTINARSKKRLYVRATSSDPVINIVGARLKLEFSNGQKMTVIPQITRRISGGGGD